MSSAVGKFVMAVTGVPSLTSKTETTPSLKVPWFPGDNVILEYPSGGSLLVSGFGITTGVTVRTARVGSLASFVPSFAESETTASAGNVPPGSAAPVILEISIVTFPSPSTVMASAGMTCSTSPTFTVPVIAAPGTVVAVIVLSRSVMGSSSGAGVISFFIKTAV